MKKEDGASTSAGSAEGIGQVWHLTAASCLRMLPRILRRAPNIQPRNTCMISSVKAPSADLAELPRIVAAAAQIYESAPSAEVR